MVLWFRKKPVVVDLLDEAEIKAASALDAFTKAKQQLAEANDHLATVKQDASNAVDYHEKRHDFANKAQQKNERVIAKLSELLGE